MLQLYKNDHLNVQNLSSGHIKVII